ncbi:MAG: ECF-type sigma factor [Marinicellaceae bacterium]
MAAEINLTQHILAYAQGEKIELSIIIDTLYVQLCDMANLQLNKLNPESISSNELVHEVYLKFSKSLSVNAKGRMHFLAIAATAMRQLIIDQLKGMNRDKRGGQMFATTLTDKKLPIDDNAIEILAVNQAIAKLKTLEPKLASTVECRYFAGYSEQETADALGVNVRTIRRYWKRAKQWLKLELMTQ